MKNIVQRVNSKMTSQEFSRLGYAKMRKDVISAAKVEKKLSKYLMDNNYAKQRLAEAKLSSAAAAELSLALESSHQANDTMERFNRFNRDVVKYGHIKSKKVLTNKEGGVIFPLPDEEEVIDPLRKNRTIWDVSIDRAAELKTLLEARQRYFNGEMDDIYYKVGPEGNAVPVPLNLKVWSSPSLSSADRGSSVKAVHSVLPSLSVSEETAALNPQETLADEKLSRRGSNETMTLSRPSSIAHLGTLREMHFKSQVDGIIKANIGKQRSNERLPAKGGSGDHLNKEASTKDLQDEMSILNKGSKLMMVRFQSPMSKFKNFNNDMGDNVGLSSPLGPPLPLPEPGAVVSVGKMIAPGLPPSQDTPVVEELTLEQIYPPITNYIRRPYKKNNPFHDKATNILEQEETRLRELVKKKNSPKTETVKMSGRRVYENMKTGSFLRRTEEQLDLNKSRRSSIIVYKKPSEELSSQTEIPNYMKPKAGIPFTSLERLGVRNKDEMVERMKRRYENRNRADSNDEPQILNYVKSGIDTNEDETENELVLVGSFKKDPRYTDLLGSLEPLVMPTISEWRKMRSPNTQSINFSSSLLHKYGYRYKYEHD